jgi:hypothetical protein
MSKEKKYKKTVNWVFTNAKLEKIKNMLPLKPFPEHIHKIIAKELNYSNSAVYNAIAELNKREDIFILNKLTMVLLRKMAKEKNIKLFSKLRKKDLISLIIKNKNMI